MSKHFTYAVAGKYPNPDDGDKLKTAFIMIARICFRKPKRPTTSAEWKDFPTCISNLSTVELSSNWAQSKGLIVDGKGTLNFMLVWKSALEVDVHVGGRDSANIPFRVATIQDRSSLVKFKVNGEESKDWNDDLDKNVLPRDFADVYPLQLRVKLEENTTLPCFCPNHVKGSANATELNWIISDDLDKPYTENSIQSR